jgi:Ca2+-binding RTX toxin-like protein
MEMIVGLFVVLTAGAFIGGLDGSDDDDGFAETNPEDAAQFPIEYILLGDANPALAEAQVTEDLAVEPVEQAPHAQPDDGSNDRPVTTEDDLASDDNAVPTIPPGQNDQGPITLRLTNDDDYFLGTTAAENVIGRQGDDTLIGNGGADSLVGWGGDDTLTSHGLGGMLSGNQGDDELYARKAGFGQYHLYGGEGDDRITMHLDNQAGWGHQGFHVDGGAGADEFRFVDVGTTDAPIVSRIEDFDPSQDSIWVDDEELDLNALPSDMRIIEYHGQQWLVINENIIIGLEGARMTAPEGVPTMMGSPEEMHFHMFPTNLAVLATVPFITAA